VRGRIIPCPLHAKISRRRDILWAVPVVVLPYDPAWANTFGRLKADLWAVVHPFALAIEHVGSTSVPGLAAKPIVDMDVVVADRSSSEATISALEQAGYRHVGNLGLEGREAMRAPEELPPHNLYVCLQDSEPYRNHIIVRDFLRTNPSAVRAYGELKLRLAERFREDIEGYIDGKTDFILEILRGNGFPEDALRRAEAINRKPSQRP